MRKAPWNPWSGLGQQTVYAAPVPVPVPLHEARRRWAELLRRIFEVEPLECPRFIMEPQVVDRVLDHLRRTAAARCRSRAPPARARMVRTAAGSKFLLTPARMATMLVGLRPELIDPTRPPIHFHSDR